MRPDDLSRLEREATRKDRAARKARRAASDRKRNCWTCGLSGVDHDRCYALTYDETTDLPVLTWLRGPGRMREDGTVPFDVDGCPAWSGEWPSPPAD